MFSGLSEEPSVSTGKKIYGLPSRREPEFSIGWSNANQLNDFQMRKSKNKEVTGKITTQAIIQGGDLYPQRQTQEYQQQRQPQEYQQQRQVPAYDPLPRDYPPSYENLSQEELEKLMQRYEDYRSNVPSRKDDRLSENSGVTNEKRTPIRPRESMKDIIYNGVGVGDEGNQKAGSRQQRNAPYAYYPAASKN